MAIPNRFLCMYEEKVGITGNAPVFFDLTSESLSATNAILEKRGIVRRAIPDTAPGSQDISGSLDFISDYRTLGYYLKGVLGWSNSYQIGATAAYEHLFADVDLNVNKTGKELPSFTFLIAKDNNLDMYSGVVFDSLSLDFSNSEYIRGSANIKGMDYRFLDNALANLDDNFSVSLTEDPELLYHQTQMWIGTSEGVPSLEFDLQNFTVEIANNLSDPKNLGSRHLGKRWFPNHPSEPAVMITENATNWSDTPTTLALSSAAGTNYVVCGNDAIESVFNAAVNDPHSIIYTPATNLNFNRYTRFGFFIRFDTAATAFAAGDVLDLIFTDTSGASETIELNNVALENFTDNIWYYFVADIETWTNAAFDPADVDKITWKFSFNGAGVPAGTIWLDAISLWNHHYLAPQDKTVTLSATMIREAANSLAPYVMDGTITGTAHATYHLTPFSMRVRTLSTETVGSNAYRFELYCPVVTLKNGVPPMISRDQTTVSMDFTPQFATTTPTITGLVSGNTLAAGGHTDLAPYLYDIWMLLLNGRTTDY